MGGKGSGRPSNEEFLKKSGVVQKQNPIADGMFIPNLSGDLSRGKVIATPTQNLNPVNKKYVDDALAGVGVHVRQHSITQTLDHTSTATAGRILKADANGLPVDATNTDAQVSAAVTASHGVNDVNTSSAAAVHTHVLTAGATDVTASKDELNVLDGIPATLTATELGYCDGVTSAIQTQLNAKSSIKSNWGYVEGDGDSSCQEAVTFASAFTAIPDITANCLGYKDGTPTDRGDVSIGVNYVCTAQDPSTTGFTLVATDVTGANISAGTAESNEKDQYGGDDDSALPFGYNTADWDGLAQSFIPGSTQTLYSIKVTLQEIGNIPAGKKVWFEIWSNSGGNPNAIIANGTSNLKEAADVAGNLTQYEFTFATPPSLTASTTYFIVAGYDWAKSTSNFLQWGYDSGGSTPYANGKTWIYKNSAWSAYHATNDLNFETWKIIPAAPARNIVYSWMAKEPGSD